MATGRAQLLSGVSAQASTEDLDGLPQECCAVFLSDYSYSTAQWVLRVSCQLEAGNARAHVATIITTPLRRSLAEALSNNRPPTRAIARFNMPGARAWYVDGRMLKAYAAGEETLPPMHKALLYVDASRGNGGEAVHLFEGMVVPRQRYSWATLSAAGDILVPQGAVVQQISCQAQSGGAADITVPGRDQITVPQGTGFTFAPNECFNWLDTTTIAFGNDVESAFVSWVV